MAMSVVSSADTRRRKGIDECMSAASALHARLVKFAQTIGQPSGARCL